jgi:hypothetical protein
MEIFMKTYKCWIGGLPNVWIIKAPNKNDAYLEFLSGDYVKDVHLKPLIPENATFENPGTVEIHAEEIKD